MAWAVKCPLGVSKAPRMRNASAKLMSRMQHWRNGQLNGVGDTARQYGELIDCARTGRALSAGRIPLSGHKDTRFRG